MTRFPRSFATIRPRRRPLGVLLASGALLTACAGGPRPAGGVPAGGAPVPSRGPLTAPAAAMQVYDTKARRMIPFATMADRLAAQQVVFFGEQHDDPATHAAELAVLAALGERRPQVVVTLEMFERDVQGSLDQYLAGTISETTLLGASRPWDRYTTDYRPLVELARVRGWPVIAANVPRRLASAVSRRGLALLDTLNAKDRALMARDHQCPRDAYFEKFAETMKGHGAGGGPPTASDAAAMERMTWRFYEAQCVKDEAMAESIVSALSRSPDGTLVFQVDGAFHSDYGLGTAARVRRRLPGVKSVVLSAIPVDDPRKGDAKPHAGKADYLVFTRKP